MHSMFIYSVQTGDTLQTIARGIRMAAGVSSSQILQANAKLCVHPPMHCLPKGELIMVPAKPASAHSPLQPAFYYLVFEGDTLICLENALACCHGITATDIARENQECASLPLVAGMELSIPGDEHLAMGKNTKQPGGLQVKAVGETADSVIIQRIIIEEYYLIASEVPKIYH